MRGTYEKVREKALPLIEAYFDDLILYDRDSIHKNPGIPFLHFTGSTGTCLVLLAPGKDYPKKGEKVPYLFGIANRDHILKGTGVIVYCMRTCNRQELILYFNGKTLIEITQDRAEKIIKKYMDKIFAEWRREHE